VSYKSGMAALNMEFTDTVPRTEYSVESYHWQAIQKVTGIDTTVESNRQQAQKEFIRKWDYAFIWSTPTAQQVIHDRGRATDMGHAEYSADGSDKSRVQNINCPFKTVDEIFAFDPYEEYGQIDINQTVKEFNEMYHKGKEYWGDITLTMGGVYVTLFSGLIEMFGWDMLLMAMGTDEKKFSKIIDKYVEYVKQYFIAWSKTDIEAFMSHDDICWTSGPVAHPDWYRKYIFPRYKELWKPVLDSGKKLLFTSDGTYDMFFDDIVDCGANSLVMEPTNNMKQFADKYGKTHGFVGNADTRILLFGKKDDIYKEVKRCMDIGKKCSGYVLAVGNHIPANTPLDNVLYYNDAYMELRNR